jgi:hypothetical protein
MNKNKINKALGLLISLNKDYIDRNSIVQILYLIDCYTLSRQDIPLSGIIFTNNKFYTGLYLYGIDSVMLDNYHNLYKEYSPNELNEEEIDIINKVFTNSYKNNSSDFIYNIPLYTRDLVIKNILSNMGKTQEEISYTMDIIQREYYIDHKLRH